MLVYFSASALHLNRFPSDDLWWKEMFAGVQESIEDADVGYEVTLALNANKKVLALVKDGENGSYIRGLVHPNLKVVKYRPENVANLVGNFLKKIQ